MKISKAGVDLIKSYEGLRLKAYKPVAAEKYYTIGYGHYGPDVSPNDTITYYEAEQMLMRDLVLFENHVKNPANVPLPLNQNQFDALVSFTYNCGAGNLKKLCKGRNYDEISNAMQYYVHGADGKKLPGLVRRRQDEIRLFNKEVIGMSEIEVAQIVKEILDGTVTTPATWAEQPIENAVELGITDGSRPGGYATRQEVITMIMRFAAIMGAGNNGE